MRLITGKPVYWVSDQAPHKPGSATTEDGFGFRKWRDCTIFVAKIKALISCTADLRLHFRICKKNSFLMMWFIFNWLMVPKCFDVT